MPAKKTNAEIFSEGVTTLNSYFQEAREQTHIATRAVLSFNRIEADISSMCNAIDRSTKAMEKLVEIFVRLERDIDR